MTTTTARDRRLRRLPLDGPGRAWAAEWFPAAIQATRRWQAAFPDLRDEIESEAHLALLDATARRHEAEEFAALLTDLVRRAAWGAVRQARPLGYRRAGGAAPESSSLEGEPASREPAPDRRLIDREFRAGLDAILSRNQAEAIRLTVLDGYSREDAAGAMGLSVGTVKKHLDRARPALRAAMAG